MKRHSLAASYRLSESERARIVEAVRRAESATRAEIRVCIERVCLRDPLRRAARLFRKLGMQETKERNAVLIYVARKNRRFAIVGDEGIHALVGAAFWDEVARAMRAGFRRGGLVEGIEEGVRRAGETLTHHFPALGSNENELPDDPVEM